MGKSSVMRIPIVMLIFYSFPTKFGGNCFRGRPLPPVEESQFLGSQRSIKSVQSALSDLLTTSVTHGTFPRPSTKHGLILIGLELNTNARESFEHC